MIAFYVVVVSYSSYNVIQDSFILSDISSDLSDVLSSRSIKRFASTGSPRDVLIIDSNSS